MSGNFDGLILDVNYMDDMDVFFKNTAEKAEKQVDEFLKALEQARATGLKKGEVADALGEFAIRANILKDRARTYSDECRKLIGDFVKEIYETDTVLY